MSNPLEKGLSLLSGSNPDQQLASFHPIIFLLVLLGFSKTFSSTNRRQRRQSFLEKDLEMEGCGPTIRLQARVSYKENQNLNNYYIKKSSWSTKKIEKTPSRSAMLVIIGIAMLSGSR